VLSLACQREEEASSGASSKKTSSEVAPGTRSSKTADRSESKRSIPTAEPVPDQPGFVRSPYNGNHVDVTGVPAGTVMADPGYPAEEEKQFRVPEMGEPATEVGPPPPPTSKQPRPKRGRRRSCRASRVLFPVLGMRRSSMHPVSRPGPSSWIPVPRRRRLDSSRCPMITSNPRSLRPNRNKEIPFTALATGRW